jgi:oligopeptide transport system substrate-binding protein
LKAQHKTSLIIGLLLAGWLAGCHPASPGPNATLRRGLGGEPSTLDPGSAADTFSTTLLIDLYEGLTAESPAGEVIPGVAAYWTLDPSGTEYTFQIRTDARWSNGRKLRAQDFVASWRREIDPKFGSPSADDLRLIVHASAILAGKEPPTALGVSAPSDSVLVVTLERPAPYFPQMLAHPSTFPIYSELSAKTHQPGEWVSNGPYTLAAWQPGTGIDLRSNPAYWDRSHVHIQQVSYQFIPDEASQYARYRAGELDMTDTVPANALPSLRREHPSELVTSPFLATAYYGINLANKTLSNAALRQALAMAIDRKRLVESLGFGQVGAYGFVPPGTADYTAQNWNWKSLSDAERTATARLLYSKAGFSPTTPLHMRVLFNNNEVIRRTAVLIAAMWQEVLGIEVELTAEEYNVFLQSRHDTSRWDVARLAWNAGFNDASNFLDILRTHSPNNDMRYTNSAFDAELDEAAATIDMPQRRAFLQSAEKIMLNDYPIIPLYYFVSKRLVKPYVHGVQPSRLNHLPSKGLTFEPGHPLAEPAHAPARHLGE